ncbi:MAG: hypothetical protein V7K30_12225, partial [Nostoc sp.]
MSSTILFKIILVQFSAIAFQFDGKNNITLKAENNASASNNSLFKSDKVDKLQRKALLKQTLEAPNSHLQKTKQLSELATIDVIGQNHVHANDNSSFNSNKVDNIQNKPLLKQTLKAPSSQLQKTKQLSELATIDVIGQNHATASDNSSPKSDKVDKLQSKPLLKQALKDPNSHLQKTKQLSELATINVIGQNHTAASDNSSPKSDKVDKLQSKPLLKQALKDPNSH